MIDTQAATLLTFPSAPEQRADRARLPVCCDPSSQRVQQQLGRLAPSEASVLIVGETGTGKEIAARFLHEHSRRHGPFVAVNCAAFGENLIEAELFGHEAGAFTGAGQARPGWFEVAHGGTLFLDEIGDMPLSLQAKLLRVLQERQVTRLGARKSINVDVRVIAATNVELDQAVEARQFRRDLYYRLAVASVRLPPLRERRADIVPLAQHFIELQRRKLKLERVELTPIAQRSLLAYAWPGNIRELENVIHYALIMSQEGRIEAADLRLACAPGGGSVQDDALALLVDGLQRLLRSEQASVYASVEKLLLITAFEHCEGNQVHTARRLGVSRNILRAQLKRFGLLGRERAENLNKDAEVLAMAGC